MKADRPTRSVLHTSIYTNSVSPLFQGINQPASIHPSLLLAYLTYPRNPRKQTQAPLPFRKCALKFASNTVVGTYVPTTTFHAATHHAVRTPRTPPERDSAPASSSSSARLVRGWRGGWDDGDGMRMRMRSKQGRGNGGIEIEVGGLGKRSASSK